MLKINTPTKAQDLYEVAQEAPYPMAKRALEAIKEGGNEDASLILEELLGFLHQKNSFRLYQYARELIFRVILWKQLPESEKEGVWLTEIDKYREKIALLFYKEPELYSTFEAEIKYASKNAMELAESYIKDEPILVPSREDIFETEHDWKFYLKDKGNEQER